ncbi:hypothetical protein M0R45_021154 [Rubus argutus]|uniref:UBC core domain-containing protein n=1 Tax=Rubus argutus TaxID=59490 RepID=A0AAW1XCS6_RUBAR
MARSGNSNEFKGFAGVIDLSDHHYKEESQDCLIQGGCQLHRKIMREWKILKQHLPESIYVRVSETHVDLLRAAIVGAAGTPYHDGLFFFDLKFPLDYPNHPPQVYYRSHGLELNPNLYPCGYVCLSLLNTWRGEKEEMWDPSRSTILQVLVSIQALILNDKPFFNEPDIAPVVSLSSEKSSRAYNEDAFVSTLKSTLFLLRNPPKEFEDFTADHFGRRAGVILSACGAYANSSVEVGYYSSELKELIKLSVSNKFKKSMEQLYPKLVEAFEKNAPLEDSLRQFKVWEADTSPLVAQPKRTAAVVFGCMLVFVMIGYWSA